MHSFATLIATAAVVFTGAFAQDSTNVPLQGGVTHSITVGANGTFAFSPANITATIGDVVNFVFMSKNHTFTQSSFTDPCTPLVNTSIADPSHQILSSGFQFVPANTTSFPVFSIQITQSTPLWFFCEQTGHCSQKGMVGAINANPNANNSFAAFQAKALLSGTGGVTTSILPSGSSAPTGSASSSSGTSTSSSTASSTPNAAVSLKGSSIATSATVGLGLVGVMMGMML